MRSHLHIEKQSAGGSECKTGGDAAEAAAKADRRIGEQEALVLVTESQPFLTAKPT
jgi:hypothetical protein